VKHQARQHDEENRGIDLQEQRRQQRHPDLDELEQVQQRFADAARALDPGHLVTEIVRQAGQQPHRHHDVHQKVLQQELGRHQRRGYLWSSSAIRRSPSGPS
jgi:hypothetical protein